MGLMVTQTVGGQAWVAHPSHMLAPVQTRQLVLAVAAITGAIALAFTALGAWPVLPFAGIEVAALCFTLRHLQQHANDEERLDIGPTQITVTHQTGSRRESWQFPRFWAQLRIEHGAGRTGYRLFLRSHGCEAEIGRLLPYAQKQALARELNKKLGQPQQ